MPNEIERLCEKNGVKLTENRRIIAKIIFESKRNHWGSYL
jgi:Fe2+ or Zn2+ uptake regulation protein